MTRVMYDAVNPLDCPPGGDVYAGYDDGAWPDAAELGARFPGKPVLRITVFPEDTFGHCLDVENGDATPRKAPGWVARRRQAGLLYPWVYCSQDLWPTVQDAFRAAGVSQPLWWIASYPGPGPVMIPGAVGHQFVDHGGFDQSVIADYIPGLDPSPQRKTTPMTSGALTGTVTLDAHGHGWADAGGIPGWDGQAPTSLVIFSADPDTHAEPTSWAWAADGRIFFSGGAVGGPYGFLLWP